MHNREVATIAIYPEQGHSHSKALHLSALAAYTRTLLHALPTDERKRHVVLTNIKSDRATAFDDNNIRIHECWEKGSIWFFWQILREIRRIPSLKAIHLQHEFNQFGGATTVFMIPALLWLIRFILGKKIFITIHEVVGRELLNPDQAKNFYLPVPPGIAVYLFRWYYRMIAVAANEFFVQHIRFLNMLKNEMGIKKSAQILPIGTEDNAVLASRSHSREKYSFPASDRVLLFFGTLDWRKGLDILLDAFDQLPRPVYRLIIAGGQPVRIKDRPEYKEWYAKLSHRIEGNPAITQIGFVSDEDIPQLFAACDLVVLPYVVRQTVSAVLNHAASYERPFIGSDAFAEHVDKIVLFCADAESLTKKIRWSFDGHLDDLMKYALKYKADNSWTRSAGILASRYETYLRNNKKEVSCT
jgi:glycosyltransferase involved in cell wall biosynthesis